MRGGAADQAHQGQQRAGGRRRGTPRALELSVRRGAGGASASCFSDLVANEQSSAQRHIFFAEREAAKVPDYRRTRRPREIKRAAVIGAGTMGAGIAMCFANAGIPVALIEASPEALERGSIRRQELPEHGGAGRAQARRGRAAHRPDQRPTELAAVADAES